MRTLLPVILLACSAPGASLPSLPRAISGQCAGVSNAALLVIGGSYFPKPLFEGGTKTWVDTIYVLTPGAATWKTFRARRAIGYAACATTKGGVVVAGGGDARSNFREVFRVEWNGKEPTITDLPSLPEPLANGAAAVIGSTVYIAGGQTSPTAVQASRALFALDLASPAPDWKRLEDCPNTGRILPLFVGVGDRLYLASGAKLTAAPDGAAKRTYLRDAWEYQPGKGWKQLPDLPAGAVAAPVLSRESGIYIFGGDDGANASRIQELKDSHPGFRKEILKWTPRSGAWTKAGEYPEGLVTSAVVEWSGYAVIPGGEDRPGRRSAAVVSVPLKALP